MAFEPAAPAATYVLGDIGGRLEIFRQSLASIGVDPDFPVIPHGSTLVQVGDIVRLYAAPVFDNAGCLELAALLQTLNPDTYIQLWGNHEYGAVNWPFPGSPWRIADDQARSISALMGSWSGVIAHAVGNTLLTHAGLTHGQWAALGRPATAREAADLLNAGTAGILARKAPHGWLLNGKRSAADADCLWAEAATETYPSWIRSGEAMPFDQIHGHDTPFDHDACRLKPQTPGDVASALHVTADRRTVLTVPAGGTFTCVDWVLTDRPHPEPWELLVLQPARELAAA